MGGWSSLDLLDLVMLKSFPSMLLLDLLLVMAVAMMSAGATLSCAEAVESEGISTLAGMFPEEDS